MGKESAEESLKMQKKYVKELDRPCILYWRHVHYCTVQ